MAKAERNKEEIGWLKVTFGLTAAFDASVIAWFVQNRVAYRRLQELEEL